MSGSIILSSAGIVSPCGINQAGAFAGFFSDPGKEAVVQAVDRLLLKIKIDTCQSPFQKAVPPVRYIDNSAKQVVVASRGAMEAAGITDEDIHNAPYRYGVLLSTTCGPRTARLKLYESMLARDGKSISATLFSNCGYNIAGSLVAGFLGMRGINLTLSGHQGILFSLLSRAVTALNSGRLDTVFAGYTDYAEPEGQDDGGRLNLASASCVLCLEKPEHAEKRDNYLILEILDADAPAVAFTSGISLLPYHCYGIIPGTEQRLEKIAWCLHPYFRVYHDYLLFLLLGMLWSSSRQDKKYWGWIIPVQFQNRIFYLKARHKDSPVC